MIAIVDYGAGNLQSVKKALDYLGVDSAITSKAEEISNSDKIILPGVGSFGQAMNKLRERELVGPLKKGITEGKPFLGICLGLQLLFKESEESPSAKGLEILEGKSTKFRKGKVPHIGWNKIIPEKGEIFQEGYAYFVNSYYVILRDKSIIATTTDYFVEFASAIRKENITGVQFHPEKSGQFGINLLRRWLTC